MRAPGEGRGHLVMGQVIVTFLMLALVPTPVTANQPPVAVAGDDQTVKVGALVRFGASDSSDPDGDNLAYRWDFDASNGIQHDSTLMAPTHIFTAVGFYTVTLTVYDGTTTSNDSIMVTVNPDYPPNVDIGDDINAEVNERIYFDARNVTDANNDALTYSWDFDASNGLQTDSNQRMPEWKYSKPGTYKVTLTVSDGKNKVNDTLNVTVDYNREIVGGKSYTSTKTLKAGQKMIYMITLTKGRGLDVKISPNNGTKVTTYLFGSQNFFKFEQNGQITAISQGSKENATKVSYSVKAPSTDDYYIMVTNPSSDSAVYLDYTITIKNKYIEGTGIIPGPAAIELVSSLILITIVLAMFRKRSS